MKREGLESALLEALKKVGQMELSGGGEKEKVSLWDRVRGDNRQEEKEAEGEAGGGGGGGAGGGFSFGFDLDGGEDGEEES